ncbi:MAG TPA: diacylglycerol kinase family protein [Bacteroidia bacterium]|nr:diacylglycerol kinase family protein [Bacteroidia bacterium]
MSTSLLFIINPIAGGSANRPDAALIDHKFKNSGVDYKIVFTTGPGHAGVLAREAAAAGVSTVVAAGGDGTVNEAATGVYGSATRLGIIPCGSGNGLARHHHIPLRFAEALDVIEKGKTVAHDATRINDKLSFNVSGIGFDAHVANLFGSDGKRGFSGYLKLVVTEFSNYHPHLFTVTDGNSRFEYKGFFMAIGNASQYGNGARIAPDASTQDGLVDFTVILPLRGYAVPGVALKVFTGTVKKSRYANTFRSNKITLTCEPPAPLHIDGEPGGTFGRFTIACESDKLQLIVP